MLLRLPPALAAGDASGVLQSLQEAFVQVAQAAKPAVVNVATTQHPRALEPRRGPQIPPSFRGPFREFFGEDFFNQFFGEQPQRERRSLGSGVIVDKRGYILTNNHVIEQADQIEVRLSDNRKFQASVVGKDPKTDLAVIKIDAAGDLPVATLGNSDMIRTGEWAIAIGNPFGLDQTVTVGVISGVGRSDVGITTYEDFIQTDASINPGNSGGPLVNLRGEVVGINTAIVATGQGIGFAIPINMARSVMEALIAKGKVTRGWLGIGIQELTDNLAAQFGVKPGDGVLVGSVMKDGPAERGGMKVGDIVQEFGGTKISGVHQLQREVAQRPANSSVLVTVLRSGQPVALSVVLGEQPGEMTAGRAVGPEPSPAPVEPAQRFGLHVQDLTPALRTQPKQPALEGILVSGVEDDGPAARAGIRTGDVITEANRTQVRSTRDFAEILSRLPGDANLLLLVQREGSSRFVVLVPKG